MRSSASWGLAFGRDCNFPIFWSHFGERNADLFQQWITAQGHTCSPCASIEYGSHILLSLSRYPISYFISWFPVFHSCSFLDFSLWLPLLSLPLQQNKLPHFSQPPHLALFHLTFKCNRSLPQLSFSCVNQSFCDGHLHPLIAFLVCSIWAVHLCSPIQSLSVIHCYFMLHSLL